LAGKLREQWRVGSGSKRPIRSIPRAANRSNGDKHDDTIEGGFGYGIHVTWLSLANDHVQSAATGGTTIVLTLNAARLQPIVTGPLAVARARLHLAEGDAASGFRFHHQRRRAATDHLPPTRRGRQHAGAIWAGQPAAALPGARIATIRDSARTATDHLGFHPAAVLRRHRTGHHHRSGSRRHGLIWATSRPEYGS
jgi:hypothetical protein